MNIRAILPFCLAVFASYTASGQQQARIIDPSALLPLVDPAHDDAIRSGLADAGIGDDLLARINTMSGTQLWPEGLATDSSRRSLTGAIRNLHALHVCDLPSAAGTISVLELPVASNYHMNESLRSKGDLYLFIQKSGWEAVEAAPVVQKPSRGPAWQRMKRARIMKPEEVYATYDLGNDAGARELMERKGFSKAEIDAVLFRSHERNWPEAISQFGSRYERLPEFKRYKAYAAGSWGDKVLVVIPAAENRKMREPMRPPMDIYMVYASNAVSVSEGKGRKR
jgi:hypothetical protein